MPQDAFTLKYLCAELNDLLKGGKVNRVVQPSNDAVVLTIYTGKGTEKLLLDSDPSSPKIGIIERETESPLTAPNFCMLLRKHLLSATVKEISLVGFDRIVKLDFVSSSEFFGGSVKTIYAELMGRYSNVILTENGKILGGNRGINMLGVGVRPLIVGCDYVFPPTQNKKLPSDKSIAEDLRSFVGEDLPSFLASDISGIALSTAKEMTERYKKVTGKTAIKTSDAEDFYSFIKEFLLNAKTNPCVTVNGENVTDVFVLPYETVADEKKYFDKLYKAEEYYYDKREKAKKFLSLKERLTNVTNAALKKAKKRLSAIKTKERAAADLESDRIKGEILLANVYKIKGNETEVTLDNYYDGGVITIELDNRISPAKNSENYFKKYAKKKRALVSISEQKEIAEKEAEYFESVTDFISMATEIEDLNGIKEELTLNGTLKEKTDVRKKRVERKFREYLIDGVSVKLGRNNLENDELLSSSKGEYTWLHAKDYHSSHVIIEKNEVKDSVLKTAAEICAYYSKGREGGKTEIVYTLKKHVKKPPSAKAGFVVYTDYKSIFVFPDKHENQLK